MSNRIKSLVAYVLLMTPVVAKSHPGHGPGGGDFNIMHYLTEPLHAPLIFVVTGFFAAVLVHRFLSPRLKRRSMRQGH